MTKINQNSVAQTTSHSDVDTPSNLSRRQGMKMLLAGGLGVASINALAKSSGTSASSCIHDYNQAVDYRGPHQAGVITPDTKEAIFMAFNLSITTADQLRQLFKTLSARIAFLTQPQSFPTQKNDKLPPPESGILGARLEPDSLTITLSLGAPLFDQRFGLAKKKPKKLVTMTRFPNDRLQKEWCGGDLVLQFCANSRESVIYALRDIVRHTSDQMMPVWKIDGFLPARDIDRHSTAINLFGFKDGTGNAPATDKQQMDDLVWITENNHEPDWCLGGSYQAIRLIRFNLAFWDRTPLEDQENDFGRYKDSGAPIGMKHEMDDPQMNQDPHGDRILFDSHMRRAEPRNPERHVAKLRRRSFSYSLGVLPSGEIDMGLVFISYQNDLKKGFIDTQNRLNGEPLERYIKPFGGGYYFVLPGVNSTKDYLGRALLES
ncbi:iron uptake transporter deferrochelatase/peroxidase subunit [Snodgrassella sp. CFCC 13594]|uniref:iron uptake transporter deferrochelatase/peroxidase subunit n=1 Tax=Snodgrassella sp. CFCC 13594 TaxID=1775559 RepID=UPI0009EF129A|nr:iron uptake transporter deferrochelatase/peroxidase subunit [Snodgrassella sp. CFCC 13594]